jgi:hypothetical protein
MSYIVDPNSEEVMFKIVGSVAVKEYLIPVSQLLMLPAGTTSTLKYVSPVT